MEYVILAVVALVGFGWLKSQLSKADHKLSGYGGGSGRRSSAPKKSSKQERLDQQQKQLQSRWGAVERGEIDVPAWWNDPVSEAQINRLKDDGWSVRSKSLLKGHASELIGLQEPPEPNDQNVLRFFKVPQSEAPNQTLARIKVAEILSDPGNREKWDKRPPAPARRELIRWLGERVPKGMTHVEAEELIRKRFDGMPESEREDFEQLENILDELNDLEFRADMGIKKPSMKAIHEAIEALQKDGDALRDLDEIQVVDKLLEMQPDLEKA